MVPSKLPSGGRRRRLSAKLGTCVARPRNAVGDMRAGIAFAMDAEEFAVGDGQRGFQGWLPGAHHAVTVGDPDRDRLLVGRLQPGEEGAGLRRGDLLPGQAVHAVVHAGQGEFLRLEDLAAHVPA